MSGRPGRRSVRVRARAGFALVPILLVAAGLAVFVVALMCAVLSSQRSARKQAEHYRVASAVESVAMLSAEHLWSCYLREHSGAAGDLESFRAFLDRQGIPDAGPDGASEAHAGRDLLGELALPVEDGKWRFVAVRLDAVEVARRDTDGATRLILTVRARSLHGDDLLDPRESRDLQQVFTAQPAGALERGMPGRATPERRDQVRLKHTRTRPAANHS